MMHQLSNPGISLEYLIIIWLDKEIARFIGSRHSSEVVSFFFLFFFFLVCVDTCTFVLIRVVTETENPKPLQGMEKKAGWNPPPTSHTHTSSPVLLLHATYPTSKDRKSTSVLLTVK